MTDNHESDLEKNQQAAAAMPAASEDKSASSSRGAWLRALVLGANDGLVSIASLLLGVSASESEEASDAAVAGIAGLIAGACSMGLGEYVSVASQRDTELAEHRRRHQMNNEEPEQQMGPLPNPLQAALVSIASFTVGGSIPLLASVFLVSYKMRLITIAVSTVVGLAAFGVIAARIGGGSALRSGIRVTFGGSVAMLITFGVLCGVARMQQGKRAART